MDEPVDDFDEFFGDPPQSEEPEPEIGPNLGQSSLTPRKMVNSIMAVYEQLGGDAWLLAQAKSYPKEFLGILKSVLPKDPEGASVPNIHLTVLGPQPTADPSAYGVVNGSPQGLTYQQNADGSFSVSSKEEGEDHPRRNITVHLN